MDWYCSYLKKIKGLQFLKCSGSSFHLLKCSSQPFVTHLYFQNLFSMWDIVSYPWQFSSLLLWKIMNFSIINIKCILIIVMVHFDEFVWLLLKSWHYVLFILCSQNPGIQIFFFKFIITTLFQYFSTDVQRRKNNFMGKTSKKILCLFLLQDFQYHLYGTVNRNF